MLHFLHSAQCPLVIAPYHDSSLRALQMATHIRDIHHSVPIVFLTGSPERMAEFGGFDPAIDRVFTKPVNFPALFRLLEGMPMAC